MLVVNLVDRTDVRMIQGTSRPGFALKTAETLRACATFVGQELEGNKAAKLDILVLVDLPHPAATR